MEEPDHSNTQPVRHGAGSDSPKKEKIVVVGTNHFEAKKTILIDSKRSEMDCVEEESDTDTIDETRDTSEEEEEEEEEGEGGEEGVEDFNERGGASGEYEEFLICEDELEMFQRVGLVAERFLGTYFQISFFLSLNHFPTLVRDTDAHFRSPK
jgi:hypothetical protein